MKRRTKDLIWVYIGFALFAVMITFFCITLHSCKEQISQPQESTQEQQEEIPIVYDTPIEDPATYVKAIEQLPEYPSGDEFAAAAIFLNA